MARKFLNCSCHTEGLIVETVDNELYLAMWSLGKYGGKISLQDRLRWCWNILLKGMPWCDEVILHKTEVKKFIKVLQKEFKRLK